jgi:hypothetical protein
LPLVELPVVELLLEDEELLLDEVLELLDEELLLDEVLPVLELLLEEELELLLVELVVLELPLIEPVEAVRVTRSRRAPSSRRLMRSVWLPAARLLKVAGVIVA